MFDTKTGDVLMQEREVSKEMKATPSISRFNDQSAQGRSCIHESEPLEMQTSRTHWTQVSGPVAARAGLLESAANWRNLKASLALKELYGVAR